MIEIPKRVIIYPRDVMNITGKKSQSSINLLTKLRRELNKPPRSLVTVEEFCKYTGLNAYQVEPFLKY